MASIDIRPATGDDAAELAILVDVSSRGFATWLWYGGVLDGKTDTALEHGRNRIREAAHQGGWRDAIIAEVSGEIAGTAIGYSLANGVADAVSPHPVLAPLVDLQRPLAGHWYIDSLGVYRHHRRRGLARLLMMHQIEAGQGAPVSLITESDNDSGQALYKSMGFVETARLDAVPLYENSTRHEWVRFTRDVA